MINPTYDRIGKGYNAHRRADPALVDMLIEHLHVKPAGNLLELGAGTANYARALADRGFTLHALEPSQEMRTQSKPTDRLNWLEGVAEAIPLPDNSVHAVYAVLAIHHFTHRKAAFDESVRVCPTGPIVLFTFDPRIAQGYWFPDYFPEIWAKTFELFPAIGDIASELRHSTGREATVHHFPIARNFSDRFMGSPWSEPALYLEPAVRASMSGFALADPALVHRGVEQLRADIESGKWERKYAGLLAHESYDVGYCFVRS